MYLDDWLVMLCDAVSWRLDVFAPALSRLHDAARERDLPLPFTVGYRGGPDLALLALRIAPEARAELPAPLLEAAALPGLRPLDLATLGAPGAVALRRLLDGCELVTRLEPSEVVATLRGRLQLRTDARASLRLRMAIPVRFEYEGRLVDATTTDIAAAGVFVRTIERPPMGARLPAVFFPGEGGAPGELEVVRAVDNGFGAKIVLGAPAQALFYERIRARRPHRRAPAAVVPAAVPPPRRILLASSDPWREELAAALRGGGCEVVCANDSDMALAALLDTVLGLDLLAVASDLPPGGAEELVYRVRRLGGEADLPIAVLHAADEAAVRARLAGDGVQFVATAGRDTAEVAAELEVRIEGTRRGA